VISVQASAIVAAALKELNYLQSGSPVPGQLMVDGIELFNNILDDYNADGAKVYADVFSPYTITPNLNPHLIGPTGTWVQTQRPERINGIQIILTGGPQPYVYCKPRDAAWWANQPAPTVTADYPTDFYFDPTWPDGSIYFWPVPTTAYDVQVWQRQILTQVAPATVVSMPPGYNYAFRMVLARRWADPLRKPWTGKQEAAAVAAEALIMGNNVQVPRIRTQQAGVPGGGSGNLPNFMWPYGGVGNS
jgi:hypothetical protein